LTVFSVQIYSPDHQYGQYLNSLVQQLEPVHPLRVVISPPARMSPAPGLAIVRAEPGHNDHHQVMKRLSRVPMILIGDNGHKIPSRNHVTILTNPLNASLFVQSVYRHCAALAQAEPEPEPMPSEPYLIGSSPQMKELRGKIAKACKSRLAVLICGQTGTGKGVAAMALHNNSPQRDKEFLHLNCANVPNSLLESELFGYKKGAFTGAWKDKPGRFQQAGEGTIFLDEISEMSPYMQAKLLHVLQEKEFYPLGGTASVHISSRIIAATNADLRKAMKQGRFREDLYYRLAVVRLDLPLLKHRKEDIPLLTQYFLDKFCLKYNKIHFKGPSRELLDLFQMYDWPGNIRELESCVNSLLAMEREDMIMEDLSARLPAQSAWNEKLMSNGCAGSEEYHHPYLNQELSLKEITNKVVFRVEARLIRQALAQTRGNKKEAATALKVSYKSLLQKIKNYGL
jgi:transcriptional regulator with PAS, ATPase and Fis domain